MHTSKSRAFTLIELLVVVAIIALLVTILMPSLTRAKGLARRAICASNMRNTLSSASLYAVESDDWLPPCSLNNSDPPNHLNFNHWVQWFYWTADGWQNLAFLYFNQYAEPRQLYCPADSSTRSYEANAEKGFPEADAQWYYEVRRVWAFPLDPQPTYAMMSNFAWNPRMKDPLNPDPDERDKHRKYPLASDLNPSDILMCDQIDARLDPPTTHAVDFGANVTFGDGSVAFSVDESLFEEEFRFEELTGEKYDRDIVNWDAVLDKLVSGR